MNNKEYRIISDQVGTPRLVVDLSNGRVKEELNFDEFGDDPDIDGRKILPFGFAGGLYDRDTKLVQFGARAYDPTIGRWTSKDPILFAGGDMNLYGYVMEDPVNFIDPEGLQTTLDNEVLTRIPEIADIYLRQLPKEKLKKKKRLDEERRFKFPINFTPRVPVLPPPFSPTIPLPKDGDQCEQ